MKQWFIILLLLCGVAWVYLHYHQAGEAVVAANPPAAHEPRLAPQGTFFILKYVAVPTPRGIIGFEPGQMVHFVRSDYEKGSLIVSDGQYEVEVRPDQLTNDLDIAALARIGDADSQRQITVFIDREKAEYERQRRAADMAYAKEIEQVNAQQRVSSTVGAPPSGNNPYSYLSQPGSPPH